LSAGNELIPGAAGVHRYTSDDHCAFLAGVVSQLARRELQCAASDLHTNSLIAFQFEVIERLLGAKVSNASASNDTVLDRFTE
jgi:hypothetical protein